MASQVKTQTCIESTHPYTCNSCQVAFRSSELQRAHMQTDWHRYNLKRRVASLPPLSSQIFTEKVLASKASAAAVAARASYEKPCLACQKTYFSENAYSNHLNSSKHKVNAAKEERHASVNDAASVTGSMASSAFSLGESMPDSELTIGGEADEEFLQVVNNSTATSPSRQVPVSRRPARLRRLSTESGPDGILSPTSDGEVIAKDAKDSKDSAALLIKSQTNALVECLFCNYKSPNFSLNVAHMERYHGLFVPEKEYLVEAEGLVKYLHNKIHVNNECLKCHKVVHTASGIQTHMRDRGHCMIAFESDAELVEVGQFYDFRSSYPDAAEFDELQSAEESYDSASTAEGGIRLGAHRTAASSAQDQAAVFSDKEEDEGWETDSTISSVPTDEIVAVPIDRPHRHKSLNKSRHHTHIDPRPHRSADGFHSHAHSTPHAVYYDDFELHLPSGRTAGHRSLNRYYRQNLRGYPSVSERFENAQRRLTDGSTSDQDGDVSMYEEDSAEGDNEHRREGRGRQVISRADGGMGLIGLSDASKAKVRMAEKRDQKREQRAKNRYQAGNEKRANFQKHFRDPLLQ